MLCCILSCITPFVACCIVPILVLFFTGHISLLPELVKLILVALWSYIDVLYHWLVPRPRKSIAGLTALVTGAGHGIGRHIALALTKKGVKVVLWDINTESIDRVTKEVKDLNGKAYPYTCDVTKKDEVYETASKVKLEVGDVHILVNNAGIVVGKHFLSCSDKDIKKTMDVNLMAHFWTLKAFLNEMVERNNGHIVAISSILGLIGSPALVDYCVSKASVLMLMESLRQEIMCQNNNGVKFTTILPAKVDTGLFEGARGRFSMLPPTVQPEYVAMKTIDAIERNETFVIVPKWLAAVFATKPFLPQKLIDELLKFAGHGEAMKEFTGHNKES